VVIICLLEDLSLGRSSTVRGYGHNDAILHLLGGERKLLVHNGIEAVPKVLPMLPRDPTTAVIMSGWLFQ